MSFVEAIARKRDGFPLDPSEIRAFVAGASRSEIPDEQLAALLMAICIRGASEAETQVLVEAMRDSGEVWELARRFPTSVDKHSTGGVGDSVSLVFAPLLAACGVPVAMMAGAGLGHSQGTLDKLAAIPGFTVAGSRDQACSLMERCLACFAAQSATIAPADRKLYALRDVTATVPSLPLIVGSIMSKKLAVGAGRLVLDVKAGSGAFCKTPAAAGELARALLRVAEGAGTEGVALVTDMGEPLGTRLGCACEVRAALDALEGSGEERLRELSVALVVEGLVSLGRDRDEAEREVRLALASGRAREQWDAIVESHGGDPDPARLPLARTSTVAVADRTGYVTAVDAEALGWIAVALGAGRRQLGDTLALSAGLQTHARIGDPVEAGQPLVTLEIGEREVTVGELVARSRSAFVIGEQPPEPTPLVLERLTG